MSFGEVFCCGVVVDFERFLRTSAKEMPLASITIFKFKIQRIDNLPPSQLIRLPQPLQNIPQIRPFLPIPLHSLSLPFPPLQQQAILMYYNEPCLPLFSRNPLEGVSQADNTTFSTSKRSSVTHKPSLHPLRKRNHSNALNKENVECTFEPRINPDGKKKRTVDRFVKDQEEFQRTKERKIQQLRMEINRNEEESITGTPQIDRNSKQITASHRSSIRDNIFDRLSRDRSPSHPAPEEYLFSPKILSRSKSIIRNADVGSLLYDDARRRHEKEQMVVESSRRQIDLMMSPKINRNTNALVLRKILTEFQDLVNQEDLNPVLALSILDEIFNVDLKTLANGQLAQKLVGVLAGKESFGSLRTERVKEFITIVVVGPHESKCFSQEEVSFIIENFQFLYKERVTKERKSPTPEKLTFRPKTLASSSKLANSFREKSCQKLEAFLQNQKISNLQIKEGSFTIEDLFLIDHMKRQTEIQKKKIERENLEMEECTFKPNVSTSQSSINLLKKKPKVTLKPANKAKNIMKTEYTHLQTEPEGMNVSKIYLNLTREEKQKRRKKRQAETANLTEGVKDAEKAVMRMSIGRQKREFSQSILQRGYPKNENWAEYQRQMHQRSIENSKKLKGFTSK